MPARKDFGIEKGQKFTYLTTKYKEKRITNNSNRKDHGWVCTCICGNDYWIKEAKLATKINSSCGCIGKNRLRQQAKLRTSKYKIEIGRKYGRLLAIEPTLKNSEWKFLCECGNIRHYKAFRIACEDPKTKSCGCTKSPRIKKITKRRTKEGGFLSTMLCIYKSGAKKRKFEFTLSDKEFEKFLNQNCYYCSNPPSTKFYKTKDKKKVIKNLYNGIDRINNKEGYILSNCVSCCSICNKMKGTLSVETFFDKISKIFKKHEL